MERLYLGVARKIITPEIGGQLFGYKPDIFSEIDMRIDDEVKEACVLSLSNTNGSEGYFVTEDAICRLGYEVDMYFHGHLQQYADNADFSLMTETLSHIEKIIG